MKYPIREPKYTHLPLPKCEINIIKASTQKLWKERWNKQVKIPRSTLCRPQTPIDLPKQIMKLCRYDMSKRIASVEDRKIFVNSRCWLCNREKESPEHMIFNCDALAVKRADTLGGPTQLTTCFRIHQISRPHEPFLKVILWIWIHPLSKRMALGSLGQALSPSGVGPRTEKIHGFLITSFSVQLGRGDFDHTVSFCMHVVVILFNKTVWQIMGLGLWKKWIQ